ncbi:uncharacterized protein LOC129115999 [Anoplopoma fimbria]|uniref:uncharacterized protein LOC129115999 n=2 Tax=Anoplopoma fimbria TaxID=229290 RepID=UPI0023EC3341|nr:uncharacterized protein LOC129115999 [Anoplopoma fimbria]
MEKTFSHRRLDIVEERPMIGDFKDRWPALFQESGVNEEFLRITTKPLQTKFLAQLDHFSEKLFQIFESQGGVKGQKIKRILAIKDERDDIEIRRECVLKSLIIYLNEDPDSLFKEYLMVENALLRKPGGEDVLEEYKSENTLTHSTRRHLVNILTSHMTEMHGRIVPRQQKEKYALGIITLFPSLKDPFSPKGYLNQDFLLLFGGETASKMLEKWDTAFKYKVIKEAKQLTQSKELCRLLNAAEKPTENDDTSKSGRKRSKISASDAVEKMVHFHKSCCSIDEHLRGRKGQQPYILAAGRTQNKIDNFYIVVDKQLIPCQATSSLGAFDELFKSHYVFNLSYEESLVQLYTFVQTTVYNIDVTTTDESPRIRELRAKLLN